MAPAMNKRNEILKRALAVARASPSEALDLLEVGLEKARQSGDQNGVAILAKHAGVVSAKTGDLLGAIKYYDEALSADPRDSYLHFARGDLYRTLGQDEQARFAFTRSLELATEEGDVDLMKMASQARVGLDN